MRHMRQLLLAFICFPFFVACQTSEPPESADDTVHVVLGIVEKSKARSDLTANPNPGQGVWLGEVYEIDLRVRKDLKGNFGKSRVKAFVSAHARRFEGEVMLLHFVSDAFERNLFSYWELPGNPACVDAELAKDWELKKKFFFRRNDEEWCSRAVIK
ncbi:MAG: hypothetical protein AAFX02_05510 [Pseudomonadota bacterium]